MGIVNVTPDSFSDGGRFVHAREAVAQALRLAEEGAEILDIGGESTRPGAQPVEAAEELRRVLPVIEQLRPLTEKIISVDTYKSGVADKALAAGADVVNDVSGFRFDPAMPKVVSDSGAGVILMQIRGTPASMHQLPPSTDIVREVVEDLERAIQRAETAGITRDRIMLDPGIGFGKNPKENLILLNRLAEVGELGFPVLVGPSRKSFVGRLLDRPVEERLLGTAAACAVSILRGAHVLRVHNVGEIRQVTQVVDAVLAEALISERID